METYKPFRSCTQLNLPELLRTPYPAEEFCSVQVSSEVHLSRFAARFIFAGRRLAKSGDKLGACICMMHGTALEMAWVSLREAGVKPIANNERRAIACLIKEARRQEGLARNEVEINDLTCGYVHEAASLRYAAELLKGGGQ